MRKGGFLPEVAPGTTPQQLAFQDRAARILLAETIRTLPEREDVVYTLRYEGACPSVISRTSSECPPRRSAGSTEAPCYCSRRRWVLPSTSPRLSKGCREREADDHRVTG